MSIFTGNSTVNSNITATTADIAANSTTSAISVFANGNVGLNNSAPTHKVSIGGDARVSGNVIVVGTLVGNVLGVSNNALFLGGIAAASYVQNTDSRTLSGNINFTAANNYFTNRVISDGSFISTGTIVARGGGAAAEGGQLILGYGNNLAASIVAQANNTVNLDVTGGNTGSTPLLRLFFQHNDATTTSIWGIANTGRIHFGSIAEQTDSIVKITGTTNTTGVATFGANVIITGNVGIGNTTPASLLVLQANTNTAIDIRRTSNGQWNYIQFTSNNARKGYLGVTPTDEIQLGSDGTIILAANINTLIYANNSTKATFYANGLINFATTPTTLTMANTDSSTFIATTAFVKNQFGSLTNYTPTLSAASGSFTNATANGFYITINKMCYLIMDVAVVDRGTAAGYVRVTLPVAASRSQGSLVGRENGVTGKGLTSWLTGSNMYIQFADSTFPGANSASIILSGWYHTV